MQLFLSLLVALPTVFVAATLAVMLENVRERNRNRRWVLRNLHALVAIGQSSPLAEWDRVEQAVRRWLDAGSPDELDEESWGSIVVAITSGAPDISPLLRSEAATSISAELFTAVNDLDISLTEMKAAASRLHELLGRDVLPLWYERRVPLEGADARRVTSYLQHLAAVRQGHEKFLQTWGRFQDAVPSP